MKRNIKITDVKFKYYDNASDDLKEAECQLYGVKEENIRLAVEEKTGLVPLKMTAVSHDATFEMTMDEFIKNAKLV